MLPALLYNYDLVFLRQIKCLAFHSAGVRENERRKGVQPFCLDCSFVDVGCHAKPPRIFDIFRSGLFLLEDLEALMTCRRFAIWLKNQPLSKKYQTCAAHEAPIESWSQKHVGQTAKSQVLCEKLVT